jgi:hypothetical protein
MALVNNKHRFIFFHLFKCGGNSLRQVFNDHAKGGQELLGVHCQPRDLKHHYDVRGQVSQDRFNEYFKFTIIRNPFDFLLSTYHYVRKFKSHYMHEVCINMEFKDFPKYYMFLLDEHIKTRPHGANRLTQLYDWIIDENGKPFMDFVGKLENINEDTKIILNKIGLPPNVKVPIVNVNKMNDKPYREVYDANTRAFVEKNFKKDLEYFEYEF